MSAPKVMRQIAKALKLLKKNGLTQPATLTKFTPGVPTPGAISGGNNPTPTDYACDITPSQATTDKIGGTLVEKNDRVFVLFGKMIAQGVKPSSSDKLTVDGVSYRVISFDDYGASAAFVVLTRK